jgi:glycosyltransferase involved in cell wall biosynthesis
MRFGLYDPYLDVLGGGEKYVLTILEEAAREGEVLVMSPNRPDPERWRRLNVHVPAERLRWRPADNLSVTPLTHGLDLFVTITNHFPPLSLARRSACVVQFPFEVLGGPPRSWERRLRLRSYDEVLCYSGFVREHIGERLGLDARVLHPPVDVHAADAGVAKERRVIAVGRFFPAADGNNKKHEVLIRAWKALAPDGWELHLAGGVHDDPASWAHFEALREEAAGHAIHFHPNVDPAELQDLYSRSALFWHAAGHGEADPARQEHFGITTVEAMAHGCVPIVPALGGQLEIVADGVTGRLWRTEAELVATTAELMRDDTAAERLRAAAVPAASRFDKATFVRGARAALWPDRASI